MKARGGKRDGYKQVGKKPRLCKRPLDMLEMFSNDDGMYSKECPECFQLGKKVKNCLKCDKTFTPTCKVMFLCVTCYDSNQARNIQFYTLSTK